MAAHPQGTGTARRRSTAQGSRKQRRAFRRVQVVIEYRGGPQCSYTVSADGRSWRYEGCLSLHDVMSHYWNQVH